MREAEDAAKEEEERKEEERKEEEEEEVENDNINREEEEEELETEIEEEERKESDEEVKTTLQEEDDPRHTEEEEEEYTYSESYSKKPKLDEDIINKDEDIIVEETPQEKMSQLTFYLSVSKSPTRTIKEKIESLFINNPTFHPPLQLEERRMSKNLEEHGCFFTFEFVNLEETHYIEISLGAQPNFMLSQDVPISALISETDIQFEKQHSIIIHHLCEDIFHREEEHAKSLIYHVLRIYEKAIFIFALVDMGFRKHVSTEKFWTHIGFHHINFDIHIKKGSSYDLLAPTNHFLMRAKRNDLMAIMEAEKKNEKNKDMIEEIAFMNPYKINEIIYTKGDMKKKDTNSEIVKNRQYRRLSSRLKQEDHGRTFWVYNTNYEWKKVTPNMLDTITESIRNEAQGQPETMIKVGAGYSAKKLLRDNDTYITKKLKWLYQCTKDKQEHCIWLSACYLDDLWDESDGKKLYDTFLTNKKEFSFMKIWSKGSGQEYKNTFDFKLN